MTKLIIQPSIYVLWFLWNIFQLRNVCATNSSAVPVLSPENSTSQPASRLQSEESQIDKMANESNLNAIRICILFNMLFRFCT